MIFFANFSKSDLFSAHLHHSGESSCDYYKMADHEFISKYCYGNMADYAINNQTGEFLMEDGEPIKIKLNYMKMFSYVLLCFAGFGGVPKEVSEEFDQFCWALCSFFEGCNLIRLLS